MKYPVVLTDSAFRDLEEIRNYIAIDNPINAKHYLQGIFDRLNSLSFFPKLGKRIENAIFVYADSLYLPVMNHVAIYQINKKANIIYVLRVLSHFQDWHVIFNKEIISKKEIIASNDRISLIRINQSMVYDIWRNSLDEDNRKYVPDEVFESLQEASDVVDQIIINYESQDGPFVYAIFRNKDQMNIGYVQMVKAKGVYEIGYHIYKPFTRKNYATEAVNIFLDYLKNNTVLKEIYGIALAVNKASRRVLEKTGFKLIYEGLDIYQGSKRKIVKMVKAV